MSLKAVVSLLLTATLWMGHATPGTAQGSAAKPGAEKRSRPDLRVAYSWDYPGLQEAVNALTNGGTLYVAGGNYTLTKPLDVTGRRCNAPDQENPYSRAFITISGMGMDETILNAAFTNGPVIDLTGSCLCKIENMSLNGDVGIMACRLKNGWPSFGHEFRNLLISAKKCCLYLPQAEECQVFYCRLQAMAPGGIGLFFASHNSLGIPSRHPAQRNWHALGSTTALRVFGSTVYAVKDGFGVWIEGCSATDASFIGLYMAGGYDPDQTAKAMFMLDGRKACVANVHMQDIRQEGGQYTVLYTGTARHITLQGGYYGFNRQLVSWLKPGVVNGHNVLTNAYGEVIPDLPVPVLTDDQKPGEDQPTVAQDWTIFADTWVYGGCPASYEHKDAEGYTVLASFNKLIESNIRLSGAIYGDSWQAPDPDAGLRYLLVEEESRGNVIQVPRGDMVKFNGKVAATSLLAFDDRGLQRQYVGAGGSIGLVNLTPTKVSAIRNPVKGDVAIDDGSSSPTHAPALAFYDGNRWIYTAAYSGKDSGQTR